MDAAKNMEMQDIIYVDNNATTCIAPEVFAAMTPFLTTEYGNPSSPHPFGELAAVGIRQARASIAKLLGADPAEIIFTSCGTESDSTAILSALRTMKAQGRNKIITSAVEHPAVLSLCGMLHDEGVEVHYLNVDTLGRIDLDEARQLIDEDTAIVSMMWANNEIGNIYPIHELAEMAHSKGALFHTDAVQASGKVPIDLHSSQIDFLSLSGHKLHAPKGIGILYRRHDVPFVAFLRGGHQEHLQRAGTENVASIVGLGKAAELAMEHMHEEQTRVKALRDRMERELLKRCPDSFLNGDPEHRLPNTSNISFKYVEGESILLRMYGAAKICASSGSACTSGSLAPSHVLRAMHIEYQALHGSIRFSLSRYNTDADIDTIIRVVPPIIHELREISPFGKE